MGSIPARPEPRTKFEGAKARSALRQSLSSGPRRDAVDPLADDARHRIGQRKPIEWPSGSRTLNCRPHGSFLGGPSIVTPSASNSAWRASASVTSKSRNGPSPDGRPVPCFEDQPRPSEGGAGDPITWFRGVVVRAQALVERRDRSRSVTPIQMPRSRVAATDFVLIGSLLNPLPGRGLVQAHGSSDEGTESLLIDLIVLVEVDRAAGVASETRVEQSRRILQ